MSDLHRVRTGQMLHKTQFDNQKNVSSTQIGSFTVLNIIWEGKKKKKAYSYRTTKLVTFVMKH